MEGVLTVAGVTQGFGKHALLLGQGLCVAGQPQPVPELGVEATL